MLEMLAHPPLTSALVAVVSLLSLRTERRAVIIVFPLRLLIVLLYVHSVAHLSLLLLPLHGPSTHHPQQPLWPEITAVAMLALMIAVATKHIPPMVGSLIASTGSFSGLRIATTKTPMRQKNIANSIMKATVNIQMTMLKSPLHEACGYTCRAVRVRCG